MKENEYVLIDLVNGRGPIAEALGDWRMEIGGTGRRAGTRATLWLPIATPFFSNFFQFVTLFFWEVKHWELF